MVTIKTFVCFDCHKRFITIDDQKLNHSCTLFDNIKLIELEYAKIGSKAHLDALQAIENQNSLAFTKALLNVKKDFTVKEPKPNKLKGKEWYEN